MNKNISEMVRERLMSKQQVLVAHANETTSQPREFGSWLEFWENYMDEHNLPKNALKGKEKPVGAHVIDSNGKVYIYPSESSANSSGKAEEKELFYVVKSQLAPVSWYDTKDKETGRNWSWNDWNTMMKANEDVVSQLKN